MRYLYAFMPIHSSEWQPSTCFAHQAPRLPPPHWPPNVIGKEKKSKSHFPRPGIEPVRWIQSPTLYHVAIKAGFYRKAVEVYHIPNCYIYIYVYIYIVGHSLYREFGIVLVMMCSHSVSLFGCYQWTKIVYTFQNCYYLRAFRRKSRDIVISPSVCLSVKSHKCS